MQREAGKDKYQQGFLNKLGRLTNPGKITMNKRLMIFSFFLLLSVILWFLTALGKNYNASISYPVRYIKLPEDRVLVNKMPDKLLLSVNAQGYTLLRYKLKSRLLPIIFDVKSFRLSNIPGEDANTVYILTSIAKNKIQKQLSSDIEVLDISPDSLIFRFASEIDRQVPVLPEYNLSYAKQYMQVRPVSVVPDSITVSGPETVVDTIRGISTVRKDFRNVNKTIEFTAEVIQGEKLNYSHDKVRVRIPVEKFTEASFSIPLEYEHLPDSLNLKLFPDEVKLTCRVGLSDYDQLSERSFRAVVDFLGTNQNLGNKLQVELTKQPGFVRSVSYHPKSVEYIIERK